MDVHLGYAPNGEWTTVALIDTGAPITIFDRGTADGLGIRLNNTGADKLRVKIMGGDWDAQWEYVDLGLVGGLHDHWSARVAFVIDPRLQMPFQGILGTDGFLDKFAVTFNRYYDYFAIEKPDDWDDRIGAKLEDPTLAVDPLWNPPG